MEHVRFGTICLSCVRKTRLKHYAIEKVKSSKERNIIQDFVKHFWGEQEQLTFNRSFTAHELPAYVVKVRDKIVGFVAFAEFDDAVLIVALGVTPLYQNSGVGKSLIEKVEDEAKRLGKKTLLVSTSNDDLPALAFYQLLGFQIFEVKPNVIAEKHGTLLKGVGNLPLRDEIRLRKTL
jgi:ribosomal protein S18 acetylase RimI-like enzyme